jgi:hypothetical protein
MYHQLATMALGAFYSLFAFYFCSMPTDVDPLVAAAGCHRFLGAFISFVDYIAGDDYYSTNGDHVLSPYAAFYRAWNKVRYNTSTQCGNDGMHLLASLATTCSASDKPTRFQAFLDYFDIDTSYFEALGRDTNIPTVRNALYCLVLGALALTVLGASFSYTRRGRRLQIVVEFTGSSVIEQIASIYDAVRFLLVSTRPAIADALFHSRTRLLCCRRRSCFRPHP